MRLTRAGIIAIIFACVALGAASAAFAYPSDTGDSLACADCHGREGSESTETVAATRKGPHGGYTAGTSKCKTCHSVHDAPAGGILLLPEATVEATCKSCHDGTGGAAVYGVIKARTNTEPAASHSMSLDATNTIPGGDGNTGGSSTGTFSGPGGTLSCNDCHSPHDSQTVEPFTGDRLRASVASDTAYAGKTNRLLKRAPTSAETSVSVYGASWCATCHKGRVGQHSEDSGLMQSHPVLDSDDEYYYDNVQGVAGADTTETALGSLGQSNRGYVVPEVEDPEADPRPAPLCQQCHEDARNVGPSERGTNPMLSEDQTFTVSAYASLPSEETTDNPRFQVFPHESDAEYFLVRPVVETFEDTETATYQLCLNCHSLLHEVPEEYASCAEAGCHDEGDAIDIHMLTASGCNACHGALEPLTMDCATCHGEDPHSHTDHTISFVTTGLDTDFFTARHRGGQNRRWVVNDIDCSICHDSTDIAAVHRYECATCHPGSWDEFDRAAGCQQSGCHPTYHAGALQGHNPYAPPNAQIARPCTQCHVENSNTLATPDFCTNCHPPAPVPEPVGSGLRSPAGTSLLTTSDVNEKEPYIGPAIITFTVTFDSVETTTATTYRRVDGGRIMAGSLVFVSGPGEHTIEYWSVAEDGAVEQTPHLATFTVDEDDRAPTTFSDVQPTYEGTATITLTALDNGYAGVMYTYFQLNDGPIQVWTGTDIVVPGPASGIAFHTLRYWSVDWSGNSEVFSERLFSVAAGGT